MTMNNQVLESNKKLIGIPSKHIIFLYYIIPIFVLFILIDNLFLDNLLNSYVDQTKPLLILSSISYFGFAHIVASYTTFADKEYISYYKYKLLLCFIIAGIPSYLVYQSESITMYQFLVFIILFQSYHAFVQQFSLIKIISGVSSKSANILKYLGLAICIPFALEIILREKYEIKNYILISSSLLFIVYSLLLLRFYKDSQTKTGKQYLIANLLYILFILICAYHSQYIYMILMVKIIHDITAYYFYITHDQNRNIEKPVNFIYRAFSLITPLSKYKIAIFNIVFSAFMTFCIFQAGFLKFVAFGSIFHYAIESFCWKGFTVHRKQISIV